MMPIGFQLRRLREEKRMSRRDLERKTGLGCYHIARVENGYISPSLETLQRFADALDVSLYDLFYSAEQQSPTLHLTALKGLERSAQQTGKAGQEIRFFLKLRPLLSRIPEKDRGTFLSFAKGLATH